MESRQRKASWQRNARLESLLSEMSELLAPAEQACNNRDADRPSLPVVLVVGAPRSGTTLLMQSIASSGLCAYPSNMLARFFAAPAIGARIQQLLFDPAYRFRDEFSDLQPTAPNFDSALGKTRGALAPAEFWYFWRRFLPNTEIEPIGTRIDQVDMSGLQSELRSITHAFGQPFAAKGMLLQYDIEAFAKACPELIFVHIERDVQANANSLLEARRTFFGEESSWYSAKPPGTELTRNQSPAKQVRFQVTATNESIAEGAEELSDTRYLHVHYEDFCANPAAFHGRLQAALRAQAPQLGPTLYAPYQGPSTFTATRTAG